LHRYGETRTSVEPPGAAKLRRWLAAAFAAVAAVAPAGVARAAGQTAPPDRPGVALLSQTPYVAARGVFQLRLSVTSDHPSTDLVEVLLFNQVIDRTDFGLAASGRVEGYSSYHPTVPLDRLPADPAGGVDVEIPIGQPAPPGSLFPEAPTGGSGVYPLQVRLISQSGAEEAPPLTTFVTYASADDSFAPLSVAVVIPFSTPPVVASGGRLAGPGSAEATRLNQLAGVLEADSSVPASILADPSTLAALSQGASSSAVDRQTLSDLAAVPQGGLVEVLPSTYSPVSPGQLDAAGLGGELPRQVEAGASELRAVLGVAPATGIWAADGPLDAAGLASLAARHFGQLLLPSSDLTPLPSYFTQFTFAQLTALESGGSRFTVLAADAGLSADFASKEPPVLAANRLLAELALIQTETPSLSRVVAVMPPAGSVVDPTFVSTLLAGLDGDPLLRAVTASRALADNSATSPDLVRYLADPYPQPTAAENALSAAAPTIREVRGKLRAVSSVFDGRSGQTARMEEKLLVAESPALDAAQRNSLLSSVRSAAGRTLAEVSLPAGGSITLTSNKGQLPITILSSSPYRPRVELTLSSQRLIFHPLKPPTGACKVPTPTKEVCTLSLGSQNTTLKVPVETRSSGVFPLVVKLSAPNGATLAMDQDTVRSTAVSGAGIVLIVVAFVSLAVWWVRDLRHGRRPRGMAPSPFEEADAERVSPNGDGLGPTGHARRPSGDRQRL
jgi:hypothetical protein